MRSLVVMGGLHASLNYPEAIAHCDLVLLGAADESIRDFICKLMGSRPSGGDSRGSGGRWSDGGSRQDEGNRQNEGGINYRFTIQARHEVGLDDEMLNLQGQVASRGLVKTHGTRGTLVRQHDTCRTGAN